jgi:RHS repeat-associated protein
LRLGNGKFENTQFNSRLQPIQIGLGSSATSQNLLKLNFDYGTTDNIGNGRFENTQFNSRLQPIQIGLGSSATSQNLMKLNFDYGGIDNNGNVKLQTITTPTVGNVVGFTATQNYTYDSLNRLKSAEETIPNQTGWKQTFKYDRYGNRNFDTTNNNTTTLQNGCPVTVCNPSANPNDNKLVGTNYDSVGNTKIDANGQTFIYDAENKQTKVVNAQGVTIGEYFYDGDGKRIKKIAPLTNETTIFVYDAGGKTVAEYSTITANQSEAKINYTTNDHLGSPRINTDAVGKVIARHDTMPFGEEIQRASYGSDNLRNRFTSYERDGETEEDFAEARYYNYKTGRFNSVDPLMASADINSPQTLNRYSYVMNNPLNLTDPTGMLAGCPEGKICDENGNVVTVKDGAVVAGTVGVVEALPAVADAVKEYVIEPSRWEMFKYYAKKATNSVVGKITGKNLFTVARAPGVILTILTSPLKANSCGSDRTSRYVDGECIQGSPTMSDEDVDKDANPDQADNEPSGNDKSSGGGKDAKKINKKRKESAKEEETRLRQELDTLQSTQNRYPGIQKDIEKLKKKIKHEVEKQQKSESHGRKAKGN